MISLEEIFKLKSEIKVIYYNIVNLALKGT